MTTDGAQGTRLAFIQLHRVVEQYGERLEIATVNIIHIVNIYIVNSVNTLNVNYVNDIKVAQ